MLIGEFEHSLDIKGRLILPSKIREDLGEKFILTKGLDGCLFGFSKTEWANFEEKLKTLPLTNKNARDFVRFFLSGATECPPESETICIAPGTLDEMEKEVIRIFLEKNNGNRSQTANELGISRTTLWKKIST